VSPSEFVDGIVIAISPIAVSIGPASVRWFGIAVALGLAAGLLVAARLGRGQGLTEGDVYACALGGIMAGAVGARLTHVVDKLDYYLQNPYFVLSPSHVSMSSLGALVFGSVAVAFVARRRGVPGSTALDVGVPAFLVGQIVGRLGSLLNGESWGSPSSLPWAITYLSPDAMLPPGRLGMPTHPYPVYEALWTTAALGIALLLSRRWHVRGGLAAVALLLYAAGRLYLGQFREEGAWLFGLQQAQVLAAVVVLLCVPWIVYLAATPPQARDRPGAARASRGQVL